MILFGEKRTACLWYTAGSVTPISDVELNPSHGGADHCNNEQHDTVHTVGNYCMRDRGRQEKVKYERTRYIKKKKN